MNDRRRHMGNEDNHTEEDWESIILKNAVITDRHTLHKLYTSDRDIYVTTDGGVSNSQGTFGVVISDAGSPVLQNNGKFYSPTFYESSYRSEAYGLLVGLKPCNIQ
jgi:hypothetical protein